MVQEFHVLRCSTCESFQVQQVKKVNKWSCKLCGEKQSLLKEFGRGSGADCRRHVQKLNASRGAMMEEQDTWSLRKQVEADREDIPEEHDQMRPTGSSRWSKYLDTPEEAEPEQEEEENVLMDRQQLHGNNMMDRKRKRIKGRTDGGRPDKWTPEQTDWSSRMMKPGKTTSLRNKSPPSENHIGTKSLNHTSPPSENHTGTKSLNHTSPPSENHTGTKSLNHTSPPSENHTGTKSLNHTSPPSENHTGTKSLNHTSPPSENHTGTKSLNHTSPPTKSINPPGVGSGAVSRWACFLRPDFQEEAEEPSVSGRSQSVGGAVSLSCNDIISQARATLPVSSMFENGENFSFDDF